MAIYSHFVIFNFKVFHHTISFTPNRFIVVFPLKIYIFILSLNIIFSDGKVLLKNELAQVQVPDIKYELVQVQVHGFQNELVQVQVHLQNELVQVQVHHIVINYIVNNNNVIFKRDNFCRLITILCIAISMIAIHVTLVTRPNYNVTK